MRWGAIFGSIAFFVDGLCMAFFSANPHQPAELVILLIVWGLVAPIAGGVAATVLYGLVGAVISFRPAGIEPSPFSYAFLGSLLALMMVILPFGSWLAGGLLRALQGAQGTYMLIPTGPLPVAIAGLLTGARVGLRQ